MTRHSIGLAVLLGVTIGAYPCEFFFEYTKVARDVTVTVVDRDGKRLEGVRLAVDRLLQPNAMSGDTVARPIADREGVIRLSGLEPGYYDITIANSSGRDALHLQVDPHL